MTNTLRMTAAALLVMLVSGAQLGAATEPTKAGRPKDFKLEHAAPSIDELFKRFFGALASKDAKAFAELGVTEREYREFILPGSAKGDQTPQFMSDRDSNFFWGMLNTKSMAAREAIFRNYAGRSFKLTNVKYEKGIQRYAWYVAYRDPQLTVEDSDGTAMELPMGAIAEVDGQFKFIGFNNDD